MKSENIIDELGAAWSNVVRDLQRLFPGSTVKAYKDLPPAPKGPGDDSHVNKSLDVLAPWAKPVFEKLEQRFIGVLAPIGYRAVRLETLRTNERQDWLFGIGRRYQAPGRTGIVTNAQSATGPHVEARAVDYGYLPLVVGMAPNPEALSAALKSIAAGMKEDGIEWGGSWKSLPDPAHWQVNPGSKES